MKKALEDITILEVAQFAAGPWCPRVLAEMGAEVIKIELPGSGDASRAIPPLDDGQSLLFVVVNINKKSITLDLRKEKGVQIFKELVKKADVVLENFTPGVMDRLGVGYEELRRVNPRIIYCSITGFGQYGPYHSFPAFDPVVQAMGGVISAVRQPGSPPTWMGVAVADFIGPLYAAVGILEALHYREKTGQGQAVDVSMHDTMFSLLSFTHLPRYWGARFAPLEEEVFANLSAVMKPLEVKDGYLIVCAVTGEQWANLLAVIGGVTSGMEMASTKEHIGGIIASLERWARSKTMDEALDALRRVRVPCAPVLGVDELIHDQHLQAREMTVEVGHPVKGESAKVMVPGVPVKLSQSPGKIEATSPLLGQHNEEIYCHRLGYAREELAKLGEEEVI